MHDINDAHTLVLWDTNAYRVGFFCRSKAGIRRRIGRIRKAERAKGLHGVVSPIVVWELLAHVADNKAPGYRNCVEAVRALVAHTEVQGSQSWDIAMTAFPDDSILNAYFNRTSPSAQANAASLKHIARKVVEEAPDITDAIALADLPKWRSKMEKHESDWKNDMATLIQHYDPNLAGPLVGSTNNKVIRERIAGYWQSVGFHDAYAASEIDKFAALAGVTISPTQRQQMIDDFKTMTLASFKMLQALLKASMSPDINLNRKNKPWPNYIWDYQISLAIGPTQRMGGKSVILVTGDEGISRAAARAGCKDRVFTLDEYYKHIGVDIEPTWFVKLRTWIKQLIRR